MIDVTSETTLRLLDAVALLPIGRGGAKPNLSTILRWILRGAPGLDGVRVRLEAVRLGGKWITSKEALQRFVERLTPQFDRQDRPAGRTAARSRKASARAGAKLERMGV